MIAAISWDLFLILCGGSLADFRARVLLFENRIAETFFTRSLSAAEGIVCQENLLERTGSCGDRSQILNSQELATKLDKYVAHV